MQVVAASTSTLGASAASAFVAAAPVVGAPQPLPISLEPPPLADQFVAFQAAEDAVDRAHATAQARGGGEQGSAVAPEPPSARAAAVPTIETTSAAEMERQLREQSERIAFLEEMVGSMQAQVQRSSSQRSSSREATLAGSESIAALSARVEALATEWLHAREELEARMTVMEGRMRFAEAEVQNAAGRRQHAPSTAAPAHSGRQQYASATAPQWQALSSEQALASSGGLAGSGRRSLGSSSRAGGLSHPADTEEFISGVMARFASAQELLDRTRA